MNNIKEFLYMDFAVSRPALLGIFDGSVAEAAQQISRALQDNRVGNKEWGKGKAKAKAQEQFRDRWDAYLPPAPGSTKLRLPNNMLIKYLNEYLVK